MALIVFGIFLAFCASLSRTVLSAPAPAAAPSPVLESPSDPFRQYQYPDLDDLEMDRLAAHLTEILENGDEVPLVYVETPETASGPEIWKRSRYYRRYPWKRQNGRGYDPEGYLCNPSKEDVFQLLVALHEAREGNFTRTVSFCNRRRPARAIFTNIRFLGRRRK